MSRSWSLLLLLAIHGAVAAAPWTPDPSFGNAGVATSVFGTFVDPGTATPMESYAARVIALPDGKLLAMAAQQTVPYATTGPRGGEWARVIARYNADGAVDPSFVGPASMIVPGNRVPAGALLAAQPDGKFVVADTVLKDFGTYIVVSRFLADGRPDTSFGEGGVAPGPYVFPLFNLYATEVLVTRAGAIVVVGNANAKLTTLPVVVRFMPTGALDTQFGEGGMISVDVPSAGFPSSVAVRGVEQANGAVVVVGKQAPGFSNPDAVFAFRVTASGAIDHGFGTDGFVKVPFGDGGTGSIKGILLQPDGKIVLGGARVELDVVPLLLRLTASGTLDTSFGKNGFAIGNAVGAEVADIAAQGDGRIVAVNSMAAQYRPQDVAPFVSRYDQHGVLDTSFGVGGALQLQGFGRADALAQQPDGKWIVGGALAPTPSAVPYNQPFALTRILPAALPAVEFHRADVDHYFITSNPIEIADLDRGMHSGWARTGQAFEVFGSADAAATAVDPVCRFYIPPSRGDSHFFSVSAAECAAVDSLRHVDPNYAGYVYESMHAFFALMPAVTTGTCATGSSPVYRVWNSRVDSNHRYTTDRAIRDAMVAKGWVAEGYGPSAVAMCSAP
ncbi:MAG: hypothetical protein U1F41_08825 [Burkholderiales bacterium]